MSTAPQLERPMTAEDLAGVPEDGRRYEVIGGELIVSPSPSQRHQYVSTKLIHLFQSHFQDSGDGMVFAAPFDVRLGTHDVVQPDLVVVLKRNRSRLHDDAVVGAPDLVIEIVSPSSARIDRVRKAALYASYGVPEYWIVDPDARTILAQSLVDGRYQTMTPEDDLIHSGVLPGLVIDPSDVFVMPDWMSEDPR
ncbi:MAG: Uma2 family endonuclease [Thermomicrobiales bacterium]